MTSFGGAKGGVAISGVIFLAVGLIAGIGLLPYSVVPVSLAGAPQFNMNLGVSAVGFNVTAAVHITALPQTQMILSSLTINWGSTPLVYHPHNVSGHYTVSKSYTFALVGTYAISASGVANIGTVKYTASTSVLNVMVPSGGSPGCTHLCPEVSSAFKVTTTGLAAVFIDQSTYLNTTLQSVVWVFGDGATGSGSPISHAYSAAGTYFVTETVTAANVTGATDTSSSSQNITATQNSSSSCGGTGQCNAPLIPFLTPTSGLFIGLAAGAFVWVAAWSRPELGVIALAGLGGVGFLMGLISTSTWGL